MKSIRFLSLMFLLGLLAVKGYAADQPVKKEIPVKGVVTDTQKQPIAGVVVTDGVNFTQTDEKGRYQLVSDPAQSKFVYLSVPADYKAVVEKALPVGYYARIDASEKRNRHDFWLEKREQPVRNFTFIAISDPQVRNEKQLNRFISETLPDLKETLKQASGQEAYGMVLGDIVRDVMPLYAPYKEAISDLDMTMYHVIGNHDFDLQYAALSQAENKDEYGESVFGDNFGPTDYSFNVGEIHIVAMKDIDYQGVKKYEEQFTPEQLEWLKKDLSYVKPGTTVLLNVHAPTANSTAKGGGNARNAEQLFEILKDYKAHIFAGHTHFYENRIVTPDIYEHNIGAACGAWWAGHVNRCGAPNGYLVVKVNGDNVSWQYKATGRPFDYQFRIYKPGEFKSQPKYLVVNVWDYDSAWKLSYYEDGVEKSGVLEAFADEDQDYITMKEGKVTGYHTLHLFRVRPAEKAKSIKIVATNRFGESFTQTVDLK
ncbi:calcineurin-like phosphoesterase C-terminal domain-containing protein [Bacteroides oleiciplenus]|uniref:Calcineurin-like phosphoesterase domain-containing protein n=1 Tax=Bacteroides oleiciplenus YIT 12058 TaxID=742727 RepID=K9EQU6_9BACE|nr:calcineurin-like phosphoesterase family protein [Bacteroides oleiciplenus]EKU91550.1 hypothetical protein HMPREF9447_01264 [Bacteroides oleiciplenus YIT 12058]